MDWYDWFWVILLVSIVFAVIIIPHVYAVDKMETMGVYHKDNPITCIMLPSSELEERFYTDILNISIEVVWQWQNSMYVYTKELPHNNPNGWNLPIKSIVYEKHFDKSVLDFPDCNIFIEFSKENTGQHIPNKKASSDLLMVSFLKGNDIIIGIDNKSACLLIHFHESLFNSPQMSPIR